MLAEHFIEDESDAHLKASDKDIHPVDLHVGNNIRRRRKQMHMSQEDLGTCIGVTFQQIQKYEKGTNRISSSKLYDAARALKVPVSYFFEGLLDSDGEADGDGDDALGMTSPERRRLIEIFDKIGSPETRKSLIRIATTLAGEAND